MPRKQHSFHYIYKTICLITNRYYIGMHSTSNLDDDYIGSGDRLWKSINKHGRDNHKVEILEFLPDRESLKKRERELVSEDLLNDSMCMNLAIGGDGGYRSYEQASKGGLAAMKVIWSNPDFRRKKSENVSNKNKELWENGTFFWRDNWTGKTHSDETKRKMSEAAKLRTNNKNSQFGTCWIYNLTSKESRKIKQDQLQSYLDQGWNKGRKILFD